MTRILYCEDREAERYIFNELCRELGVLCDTVETPGEALEKFFRSKYDLVMIDIGSTEGSTYDLADRIRRVASRPHLLGVSGHARDLTTDAREHFDRILEKSEIFGNKGDFNEVGLKKLLEEYGLI